MRKKKTALIMQCVTTFTYHSRDLRQGDPLSPYLFLFCAEGLSTLSNATKRKGEIRGISVTRGRTRVNHLQFADDYIIFCRATLLEWSKIS